MQSHCETVRIADALTGSQFEVARRLFEEYAERLGVDLCFQGFGAELQALDRVYGPPTGCLLLAWSGDIAVGCAAVRRRSEADCEMKRLYIRSAARGRGYGRQLATTLMDRARELGYRRMVLDTLAGMVEAQALYESLGFRECAPYYDNPLPGVKYMAVDLGAPAAQRTG